MINYKSAIVVQKMLRKQTRIDPHCENQPFPANIPHYLPSVFLRALRNGPSSLVMPKASLNTVRKIDAR